MDNNKKIIDSRKKPDYFFQTKENGLRKFIKNCPANSSCIFISKKHYFSSGGCNESFISPDQVLFLRLFSKGNGKIYTVIIFFFIGLYLSKKFSRYFSTFKTNFFLAGKEI